MGAIAFCPHPPFDVFSVTAYPIIDERWYDGKWLTSRIDYAVFPIGLTVDPSNANYILVSVGIGDKNGVVLKINITSLYDVMINNDESTCSNHS
jgi:hypothetical protein